jgi:hypothetical protein
MKRGPFWKEIEEVRAIFDVTPTTQVPPAMDILHPDELGGTAYYQINISGLYSRVVPKRFQSRHHLEWKVFLSACVHYDPPETELPAFSAYSDPQPFPIVPEDRLSDPDVDRFPRMVAPPIAMLFDTDAEVEVERWLYERAIEEIGKRYLEPLGLSIQSMLYDVLEDGLENEYHEKLSCIKAHPYIEVDEYTTEEDVKIKDFIMDPDQTGQKIQTAIAEGEYYGMQTFDQALLKLIEEDRVKYEEALQVASSPQDFRLMVKSLGLDAAR